MKYIKRPWFYEFYCIFSHFLPVKNVTGQLKLQHLKSVPYWNHFNRYLLGLVSTYICNYHRTKEFINALANYVVS